MRNSASLVIAVFSLVLHLHKFFVSNQVHLLKLSSLSPDLERVNELVYRLPVNDRDVKRLQSLNRAWATHSAHLTERFRYLKSSPVSSPSLNTECH